MDLRSKAFVALGALVFALFCFVSVYNQLRIMDTAIALSPASETHAGRMWLVAWWVAAGTILAHLGLCFILAMLMMALARVQGIALPTQGIVAVLGFAHVPLLLWALYGIVLFAGSFEKEKMEVFAGSIGRLVLARPFAYLGAAMLLVPLSVWQFGVDVRRSATFTLPSLLAIWAVLSILGMITNVIPQ